MIYVLPLTFFGCMAATLWAFRCFDCILRMEVAAHPEQWERDQKPIGFFYVPSGARSFSGSFARTALWGSWVNARPAWLDAEASGLVAYHRFRSARRMVNILHLILLGEFASVIFWIFLT